MSSDHEKDNKAKIKILRGLGVLFILALILAGHGALLILNVHDLCDDALISARYARNLAQGHGLRYNRAPADAGPVEGYSNFVWVMGLAAGERLGLHPRLATAVMGAVFSELCVLVLFIWVRVRTRSWPLALLAGAALASCLPFAIWAMQGLETAVFAFFVLAALAVHRPDRPGPLVWLFSLLACLTRPDGLLVPLTIALSEWFHPGRDKKRIAVMAGWFFILPFTAYTLFRWLYFGALIPNPFFAKTGYGLKGLVVGAWYFAGWAKSQWPLAALLIVGLVTLAIRSGRRLHQHALFAPALLILSYLLFVVAVGGDFMPDHRFVMHLAPLMIGFSVITLAEKNRPGGFRATWAISLLLAVALSWNTGQSMHYFSHPSFAREWHREQTEWYGLAASWLLRHSRPEKTIAGGDIGYLGYVTDVDRILDTNGLVDPHLARLPGAASLATDVDYVLGERPDFMVVMVHYFGDDDDAVGHTAFDRALLADSRLTADYQLRIEVPGWSSEEFSFDDHQKRTSRLRFRIYERKPAP